MAHYRIQWHHRTTIPSRPSVSPAPRVYRYPKTRVRAHPRGVVAVYLDVVENAGRDRNGKPGLNDA